jgi:formamidopyrimidine-DNA glycosylase
VPELPDVATFKRYVDSTALHQKIADVEVYRDQVLAEHTAADELKAELVGQRFVSARRHGKWLLLTLDDGRCLALHFGMTGFVKYFKKPEKEPEHDRLLIRFVNGYHLAYDSQRLLGAVALAEDADTFVEAKGLGPDVGAPDFDLEAFRALLAHRRGMVKSALMDQALMAGIGNVYSDEILFQAGIHPRTQVSNLDDDDLENLYAALQTVLETAIDSHADPAKFPDDYLTPHRGPNTACPRCGAPLKQVDVSGRTAYYCPQDQPPPTH